MNTKDGERRSIEGIARLSEWDPMGAAIGAIDSAAKLAPALPDPEVVKAFVQAADRALAAVQRLVPAAPDALIVPPGVGRIPGPATTARAFSEGLGVVGAPTDGAKRLIGEARAAAALGAPGVARPLTVARLLLSVVCIDARYVPAAVADASHRAWETNSVATPAASRGAHWEPR